MYSAILVPLDGSKTAEKVLPYARYLAEQIQDSRRVVGCCRYRRDRLAHDE